MYFLDHYNDILNAYKNATGHSREEADVEEADFYKDMEELKKKMLQKTAASPAGGEVLSRREADEIAQMYYLLFQKLEKALKGSKSVSVFDSDVKSCMKHELECVTFMDPDLRQPINELLNAADDKIAANANSTAACPHNRYLAVKIDQYGDLLSDQGYIRQMYQREYMNAKRNVHGSSDKFDAMEHAFLETKQLLEQVSMNEDLEQALPNYRKSLKKLYDAAHDYQTYKENATIRRGLKEKEKRRIAFSKMLQQFAGSRLKKFDFNAKHEHLMTILDRKGQEAQIQMNRRYSGNYQVRMKHLQKKFEENEGKFSAVNLLRRAGTVSGNASAETCENDAVSLLKGAFGGFAGESQLPGREDFLNTGKLTSAFEKACSKRTTDAFYGKDPQYAKARNTAVDVFIRKVSSMDRFSDQYIEFAGMARFLAKQNSKYDEPLREDQKTAIRGMHRILKAVKAGSESRQTLMSLNSSKRGEYADEMLNVAVMQALEAGVKEYAQNPASQVNPLFVQLAKNRDFTVILKAKIAASEEFRRFEEKHSGDRQAMIMNSYTGNDAGFPAMLKGAFDQTMKECEARSLQEENMQPEDSHQKHVDDMHPDSIQAFRQEPEGVQIRRSNSVCRKAEHQTRTSPKQNAAAEAPQPKVRPAAAQASGAKKLMRRNSVSGKTAHSVSPDMELQTRIRRANTLAAAKKQENRPAPAPVHQL